MTERVVKGTIGNIAFTEDWKDLKNVPPIPSPIVHAPVTATSYIINVKDEAAIKKFSRDCRITIPAMSSTFKPSFNIPYTFLNIGTGVLTFAKGHSSIIVHSKKDAMRIITKSGVATLVCVGENEYLLVGDLSV